jgi:serine/threonine-protein kinase
MDETIPTAPPGETSNVQDAERYVPQGVLGHGGMGEVLLCEDRRLGRAVAMKVTRPELRASGPQRAQFLREARIQAGLEHPSIVPVYDVGNEAGTTPYFTMKRVNGVTLREVLRGLRHGDPAIVEKYTQRRLLASFATVCMAVHYAHSRDVLHRDLKPSNIMFGEYAEVYVLDWGVARSDAAQAPPEARSDASPAGEGLVGTLGYLAPEQASGGPVDARADVYALGVILFEILTLQPLHVVHEPGPLLASTLAQVEARASKRAPNRGIPPELDAICVRATALEPGGRYASAREIHDAVDRYLEGDRDLSMRRETAATHARAGRVLAEEALSAADPEAGAARRARALGEASSALAFDPDNQEARSLLLQLLTRPPETMPAAARAELEAEWLAGLEKGGKLYALSHLVWLPFGVLFVLFGYSWRYAALQAALFVATTVVALRLLGKLRMTDLDLPRGRAVELTIFGLDALALASMSAAYGPLVLLPMLVLASMLSTVMRPKGALGHGTLTAIACATVLLPLGLEWLGVVPPSYTVESGRFVVESRVMPFNAWNTVGLLTFTTIALLVSVSVAFGQQRARVSEAERRLFLQTWQLRQLVPPRRDRRQGIGSPRAGSP